MNEVKDLSKIKNLDVNYTKRGIADYGKTAVLMLSYNTLEFTKLCLLSMKAHSQNESPFEIIVVDHDSKDGSREWLEQIKWANFKFVPLDYNLLFSKGNNVARNFISNDVKNLLLLNTDVAINEDGWLLERIEPFEMDSTIGITGTLGNCHKYSEKEGHFLFTDLADRGFHATEQKFKDTCVLKDGVIREVTGWSLATTVELWDKLGGLRCDPKYQHMWSDSEYCVRAQLLGYKIVPQGYNNKMQHFSGLSHAAVKDPSIYKTKAASIQDKLKQYEETVKLTD